ncbi:hypothetical protein HMPREF9080_01561 [Cardiobacterium valvarum F0432]|uniref:Uncharacterized protein n=1 Tax=Cardiobacterium valvarum F0432 TaxID=797473 RepID=G9ZFL2_9GAMM|nr:hypothetical protein HMPREF9080_01561 [Cardiobacterium valvarum F0432]
MVRCSSSTSDGRKTVNGGSITHCQAIHHNQNDDIIRRRFHLSK